MHAQLIELGSVSEPGLTEVAFDIAPSGREHGLGLATLFQTRTVGRGGAVGHRQRNVEAQADDRLTSTHAVLGDIGSGGEARDAVGASEVGLQAELFGFEYLHAVAEITLRRGEQEFLQLRGIA